MLCFNVNFINSDIKLPEEEDKKETKNNEKKNGNNQTQSSLRGFAYKSYTRTKNSYISDDYKSGTPTTKSGHTKNNRANLRGHTKWTIKIHNPYFR